MSGWGKPFDSAPGISPILKNTTANVIANGQCRRFFRSIVTGNLICIGTTFDASPCRGDSGGKHAYCCIFMLANLSLNTC